MPAHRPQADPLRWYTLEQAGELLFRSPKTIRNVVYAYELPRRLIRVHRSKRRVLVISAATIERLRHILWR